MPTERQVMNTVFLRFKYQFSTACGKRIPYGACVLLPTETKGLPKPMQPTCWNINRKRQRGKATHVGCEPSRASGALLCEAPQDGWHSAYLHPEMQMAAQPISGSRQGSGWERLAEENHSSFPGQQDAKTQRQLKMDKLREHTQGDSLSLIKMHWKTFFFFWNRRKN